LIDLLAILVSVFLMSTAIAAIEYYRQLSVVRKEYEKAREAVEDIVLSFNRQLNSEAKKLDLLAYKLESVYSKNDKAIKRIDDFDKKLQNLEEKMLAISEDKERILTKLNEVDKKTCEVAASQESLATKISTLEEQTRQFLLSPELKVEAAIPIKREKALAPLTETELAVLELLAREGTKTAPEIKERIKLSREHTARLMKKLYEEGYLERDPGKIPFKYSVKKEMENLLKKPESEAA